MIKLPGRNIDDQLKLNGHIPVSCSKAGMKLNDLSRLKEYKESIGNSEKEAIINSFIFSNFICCFLSGNKKNQKDSKTLS